jgi:hypothetical protein
MIPRQLSEVLRRVAASYPVVTVTGPRQSGKTTLVRAEFAQLPYVSLEDLDARAFATDDPRGFLKGIETGAVIDEVQRAPGILSYLQGLVDRDPRPGRFVLTGSSNLLLLECVSQTLAGRTALLTLMPFSLGELQAAGRAPQSLDELLFTGLFPPVHDRGLEPARWYGDYVRTYVERDVRRLLNVTDLERFVTFVRMCAARSGQVVNLSGLGNDCGITHNTARSWLSVLEASYVVLRLPPFHANLNKRLVKSPKLYFTDPALAAWLVGIERAADLAHHSLRGPLFETWIISELLKLRLNAGREPRLAFFRAHTGEEVDAVLDVAPAPLAIEAKSGATVTRDQLAGLRDWQRLTGAAPERCWLIYGGEAEQERAEGRVVPWRAVAGLGPALVPV